MLHVIEMYKRFIWIFLFLFFKLRSVDTDFHVTRCNVLYLDTLRRDVHMHKATILVLCIREKVFSPGRLVSVYKNLRKTRITFSYIHEQVRLYKEVNMTGWQEKHEEYRQNAHNDR